MYRFQVRTIPAPKDLLFCPKPNPLVSGAETPTLGDLRGKVFVMYEHGDCSGQGIRWGIPSKQNMWSLAPLDLKPKIKAITDQMTSARNGSGNWTVNFLSASAPPHEPFQIANIMNKLAYDSIGGAGTKQRLGIMPMGYPGEKLSVTS